MALVSCNIRGAEFATIETKTCPHCGARTPGVFGTMVKFVILLILFSAFFGWFPGASMP